MAYSWKMADLFLIPSPTMPQIIRLLMINEYRLKVYITQRSAAIYSDSAGLISYEFAHFEQIHVTESVLLLPKFPY